VLFGDEIQDPENM